MNRKKPSKIMRILPIALSVIILAGMMITMNAMATETTVSNNFQVGSSETYKTLAELFASGDQNLSGDVIVTLKSNTGDSGTLSIPESVASLTLQTDGTSHKIGTTYSDIPFFCNGKNLIIGNDIATAFLVYGGSSGAETAASPVIKIAGKVTGVYGGGLNSTLTGNPAINIENGGFAKYVYGGGMSDGTADPCHVNGNPSITLKNGGTVTSIYGGGHANAWKDGTQGESFVTGDITIYIDGENNSVYGGGNIRLTSTKASTHTSNVKGNVSITYGENARAISTMMQVFGGGCANSMQSAGSSFIANVDGSIVILALEDAEAVNGQDNSRAFSRFFGGGEAAGANAKASVTGNVTIKTARVCWESTMGILGGGCSTQAGKADVGGNVAIDIYNIDGQVTGYENANGVFGGGYIQIVNADTYKTASAKVGGNVTINVHDKANMASGSIYSMNVTAGGVIYNSAKSTYDSKAISIDGDINVCINGQPKISTYIYMSSLMRESSTSWLAIDAKTLTLNLNSNAGGTLVLPYGIYGNPLSDTIEDFTTKLFISGNVRVNNFMANFHDITINKNAGFTINPNYVNYYNIVNNGTLTLNGTLTNNNTVINNGTLTVNSGFINKYLLTNNSTIVGTGSFSENGRFITTVFTADDIKAIPDKTYTGGPLEPEASFNKIKILNQDFDIDASGYVRTYENNINAGSNSAKTVFTKGQTRIEKTFTIGKAAAAVPSAFELKFDLEEGGKSYKVTIPLIENGEYSFDGTNWSNTNIITAVHQKTEITGWVRIKGDANHYESTAVKATATSPIIYADYSEVDAAIERAAALVQADYEDFTAVQAAIDAVVRGKDITEQETVDGYAAAIEDAIEELVLKPSKKPSIIEGGNQSVEQEKEAKFVSDAEFADFQKVLIDGQEIASDKYVLSKGSTIVVLNADYLKTLNLGKHTLSIVSTTGTAQTEFTIVKAAGEPDTPETGDSSDMLILTALLFVSCTALIAFGAVLKKRSKCIK